MSRAIAICVFGVACGGLACGSSSTRSVDADAGAAEPDGDGDTVEVAEAGADDLCRRFADTLAPIACPDEVGRLERCSLSLASDRCTAEIVAAITCSIAAGSSAYVCNGNVTNIRSGFCENENDAVIACRFPAAAD